MKNKLFIFLFGMGWGAFLNTVIMLVSCIVLDIGYYEPCLAFIRENLGGEYSATFLQMLFIMIICGFIALGIDVLVHRKKS